MFAHTEITKEEARVIEDLCLTRIIADISGVSYATTRRAVSEPPSKNPSTRRAAAIQYAKRLVSVIDQLKRGETEIIIKINENGQR